MCGRIYIKTTLPQMLASFDFASRDQSVDGLANRFPTWNGPPSLEYPIIVRDVVSDAGHRGPVFVSARWGFVPYWAKEDKPSGRPPPNNARSETVATSGMFKHAYRSRRCLIPISGFFEWKAIKGQKTKRPYAIAMASGEPFCLAGIWSERKDADGLPFRTFAVITCGPNQMMAEIHDRMPVILHAKDHERWLSADEDVGELMVPFPAELMTCWPIDRKVGSPRNDTPDILDEIEVEEPDLF
ncbi:SOS response-associated peptidase [Nitratireductor mangrovi]|uniref:Abasic site processing protein n=1 Tax=Nitratireductor mangrovi TaxID=2599600 RepID=A0A5B8L220_9HYPH|nr:SOS response-associated peptidase [Nitratireductor mangrovi]QDZ01961.1 SOS response-associated peptidase [Nitratireductor mangrovi]